MIILSTILKRSSAPRPLESDNDDNAADLPPDNLPPPPRSLTPPLFLPFTTSTALSHNDDLDNPLITIENMVSKEEPRRQDFVVSSQHKFSLYELELHCKIEAYDTWRSNVSNELVFRWRPARVVAIKESSVFIAFDGFSHHWDTWISLHTGKIRSPFQGPVVMNGVPFYPLSTPVEQQQPPTAFSSSFTPRIQRSLSVQSNTSSLFVEIEESWKRSLFKSLKKETNTALAVAGTTTTTSSTITTVSTTVTTSIAMQRRRGVSGLVNLGNSCFMNSILQSLSCIPIFIESVLLRKESVQDENSVVFLLANLLHEQWSSHPVHPRNPAILKASLTQIFPRLFSLPQQQQDAQEFLCLLLDNLHESNNRITRKQPKIQIEEDDEDEMEDGEMEISARMWSMYERWNDSFVKDLFCGQFMSRKRCLHCDHRSFSCHVFFDMQLPLFSTTGTKSALKLEDLLRTYFKTEKVADFECSSCHTKGCVTSQMSIEKFPPVLVITFKRSLSSVKKIHSMVQFPVKGLRIQSSCTHRDYDLVSVVSHFGTTTTTGHYSTSFLHPLYQTWFTASDSQVTPQMKPPTQGKEAFMLFYVVSDRLLSPDFLLTL